MKVASIADVKARFSAYVKASRRTPVVITRSGRVVAALVPLEDDELEHLALSYSPRLRALLSAARRRIRAGEGTPHEEFWRAAGVAASGKRTVEKRSKKNRRRSK